MSERTQPPMETPLGVEPPADRRRWWIGLAVIVALAWFGFGAFRQSLATYTHDFTKVTANPGQLLQVPGVVDKAAPQEHGRDGFSFTILDVETHTQRLRVHSQRVKPGNFDNASQVVCIGTYNADKGLFEARQLLVKCPSKEMERQGAMVADAPASGAVR